jgi:DNA polymerase-3 subunit epsilon
MDLFYVILPKMERLIVLDTETTGIKPSEGHRIIEVGAVEILDREITSTEFQKYIQPNRKVGESVNIHGITDKFLINKPQFNQISDDLLSFIEGATLVIHNAPFDLGFLNNELKLAGIKDSIESFCNKDKPFIDTLEEDKKNNPKQRHSLDALCRRYEVDDSSRIKHGALIDSRILADVYIEMQKGQDELPLETANTESQKNDPSLIKRVKENRNKIKVIYANKDELETHENYFKN